jgi:putative alpha-1,2-mannosidase
MKGFLLLCVIVVPGCLAARQPPLQRRGKPLSDKDSAVWRYVDPFIGTTKSDVETRWGDEGGTYPGAVAPSGFMQLSPETRPPGQGGYDYHDRTIYFFSCTHHNSGFPGGSSGRLYIMPLRDTGKSGRPFSHAAEAAEPGYYRVRLEDDGTVVEAVATTRAGAFRIRYPAGTIPRLFVSDSGDGKSAFDLSENYTDRQAVKGGQVYSFTVSASARWIFVRVSTSTVNAQSARNNIAVECRSSFDELRPRVRAQWQHVLSVAQVQDTCRENKVVFYTALYHSLLVPWIISDVERNYRGADGRIHRAKRNEYGNFSPWDSFRSLHPLLSLLYPDKESDMVISMLDMYRQSGHLPVESMTGNHAVPIIVDSYMKGVPGIDRTLAYEAMCRSLLREPFLQQDMKIYRQIGYIPSTYPESVTRTVEYGYDDWALAEFARLIGDSNRLLEKGSRAYRRLFYPPELLLLPRDGVAVKTHPGNSGYKEGDAWAYSYFAPQDPGGLIDIMGGDTLFATRLDSALANGKIIFDNETVLQVPYLFNEAGCSPLTQKWVRSIMDNRYRATPGGLPGNDDLGAMSSWYVFGALGFFPVCPGLPAYSIGSPIFHSVSLRLANGKRLVIRTENARGTNSYIRSLSVDRRLYRRTSLSHALLMKGGEIVFDMAPVPGKPLRPEKRSRPVFCLSAPSTPSIEVESGQMFPISFSLRNTGTEGMMQVHVLVDGKEEGLKNCLVTGSGEVRDSILCRLFRIGRVKVRIGAGGEAKGIEENNTLTVEVVKPQRPLPEELAVDSADIRPVIREGDSLRVCFIAMNSGWEAHSFFLPLRIDNGISAMDTLLLGPGERKAIGYNFPVAGRGLHKIRVGDWQQVFRLYKDPSQASVLDLSFSKNDTGYQIEDRSGFANRVTVMGGPQEVAVADSGLLLGRDRYLMIAGNPSLDEMCTELTMMLWVYPLDDTRHGLVDIFSKGDNHVLQVTDNKTLTFFAGGWGRGDVTVDLPPDWLRHWHHIAGVCGSDGLRLYIDGQLRGYTALQKSVDLSIRDMHWVIGRNEEFPGQRIYSGYVDKPKLFQAALPAAGILSIYQTEKK